MFSVAALRKIPTEIWAIGVASFLLNISSVIVFGLSALYMKYSLGATLGIIAILEGSVEAAANLTKLFSGMVSDYLKRRKLLMILGFTLITIARPILALFPSVYAVTLARILDRLGNGIQSAPRDALVGDIAPEEIKGACFGLRQSCATAGSSIGGAVSYWLMIHSENDYIFSFWIAAIPAFLGLIILLIFVKDVKPETDTANQTEEKSKNFHLKDIRYLGKNFWYLMAVATIFYFARISESFLLINAKVNFSYTEAQTQLILMFYNGSNALLSYPVGMISDRIPRVRMLIFGILLLIFSDILLVYSDSGFLMLLGVCLWGIQIGVSQSMFIALIVDQIPAYLRGTGIGIFYLLMSISLFISGIGANELLQTFDLSYAYIASGIIAILSLIIVMILAHHFRKKHDYA
jgi:MFS family permease